MDTVDTDRNRLARYANLADGWLGRDLWGVEVGPAGELRLQTIPEQGVAVGPELDPPTGDGPAGAALDACGTGYVSEPDAGRVRILTRCAPLATDMAEVVGPRRDDDDELLAGTFTSPRGLLLGPRGRLYVAEADSVVVIDTDAGAITATWSDVVAGWCLAGAGGWVYLLDRGGPAGRGRVRRFNADGVEDVAFSTAVQSLLGNPMRMAAGEDVLLVVVRRDDGDAVVPVRSDGTIDPAAEQAWNIPARRERDAVTGKPVTTRLSRIGGIAITGGRAYIVDGEHGDVLSWTPTGQYIGSTRPLRAASDLWSSDPGVVWTYPRDAGRLARHDCDAAWLRAGTFVCGPLDTATEHARRELRVRFDRIAGGHLQLWTAITPGNVPPGADTVPLTGNGSGTVWSALPADVDVALLGDPAGPLLFVGGTLGGDGTGTPAVHQIEVGGSPSWLNLLPGVYRKNPADSEFLDRYLRLLHSVQAETTRERLDLVRRFDPWAAGVEVLDDLAAWLDVVLDERWPPLMRRGVVAEAFAAQAVRGTHRGLLAAVEQRYPKRDDETPQLKIEISEPAQRAHIWSLDPGETWQTCGCDGAAGGLGFDTMLAAAPPDGAVVGVDAVVDQSTLTGGTDSGSPLFDDLAHRFHVTVIPDPGRDTGPLDTDIRVLIEAHRPAHTDYTLCVAGPRARVGVQARVGVDAIVAGPAAQLALDSSPGLDDSALGGVDAPREKAAPAFVGQSRLGGVQLT
ncbi:MAG TPA: phage tail protein [Mycobacterium sp.]